uniref:RBR-type E3 ubiquitin transferase n=1 Tax=Macrostomum lignano TaxID=282301 RepID=A0A1I8FYR1_9PLAT
QAVGSDSRTCPHCGLLTPRPPPTPSQQTQPPMGALQQQPTTGAESAWCFDCHAPLHADRSCANFRRSQDQLLAQWCNVTYSENGQILRRAQRCPRCCVLIEKDSGCNHVICSRCGYEFCYACRAPHHAGDCVPLDLAEAAAQRSRNARLCRQFRFWEEFNRSVPLARPCPG